MAVLSGPEKKARFMFHNTLNHNILNNYKHMPTSRLFLLTGLLLVAVVACKSPTRDQQVDPRIQEWLTHYNIDIQDFNSGTTHEIPYRVTREFRISEDDLYASLYIFNADSSMAIDLDSYHLVLEVKEDGRLFSPGREVDMEVGLIDLEQSIRKRMLFCGTPCVFEEAGFHPEGQISVAGFTENDEGFVPALWEIDPKKYTVRLSVAHKVFTANEIRYTSEKRLRHIEFWFEKEPAIQTDIPL